MFKFSGESNAKISTYWVNSSAFFNFRSVPVPFQFNSIERKLNRKGTGLERNGTGIERDWNGTGMEWEWNRNGAGMERDWSGNGMGMERKLNKSSMEAQFRAPSSYAII